MEQLPYKVASVLKQIKEQIDITSHRQLGWSAEEADKKQVIVMTSEPYRKLGLKLMVQQTLYFCDINYYELENILEKIEEMKFVKSFFLVDDEIGGNSNYFKIVPEKNFDKLYVKFNIDKILNGEIDSTRPVDGNNIFPEAVMKKLPPDMQSICGEFNFIFSNKKTVASMLLLRRLLPLSIVRKFQALGKESEIKDNGDYLDTKALLGKIQSYLKEKRSYNEILGYKLLTDSSQHSYTFIPQPEDVKGAALAIRIFLEDLFQ